MGVKIKDVLSEREKTGEDNEGQTKTEINQINGEMEQSKYKYKKGEKERWKDRNTEY